jgi:LmbE family N-acetylglucosaminyl deacetylase
VTDTEQPIDRILVIVAHPDDIDFSVAGTVATWTAAGIDVRYCLVTSGEAGGDDRTMARADMATLREAEQTAAAAAVGVTELHFLHHPDGAVVADLVLRRDISRVIRIVRPQRVVCQSSQRNYDRIYASHPDHLAAAEAAIAAVYPDARNPFAHPTLLEEGHEPWAVPEVWLTGDVEANVDVDITDVIDRKVAALQSHRSQVKDPDAIEKLLREWAAGNAADAGWPAGRFAERFRRINTQ